MQKRNRQEAGSANGFVRPEPEEDREGQVEAAKAGMAITLQRVTNAKSRDKSLFVVFMVDLLFCYIGNYSFFVVG